MSRIASPTYRFRCMIGTMFILLMRIWPCLYSPWISSIGFSCSPNFIGRSRSSSSVPVLDSHFEGLLIVRTSRQFLTEFRQTTSTILTSFCLILRLVSCLRTFLSLRCWRYSTSDFLKLSTGMVWAMLLASLSFSRRMSHLRWYSPKVYPFRRDLDSSLKHLPWVTDRPLFPAVSNLEKSRW